MQRYNYSHSEYMLIKSGPAHEVSQSYDDARVMHHVDMLRYRMEELRAADALNPNLEMRALDALQRAQYSQGFAIVWFYINQLDAELAKLPVYVAPTAATVPANVLKQAYAWVRASVGA